jgi:SAM-dependent methyltransferase
VTSTAAVEGPDWSSRADAWVEHWARLAEPARVAVADAAGIGPGVRLLDVGCGSGELLALAAERGATVAGLDAAEAMIEITARRVPAADLRVGAMEALPWPDNAFDVVTAFNALQFAASFEAALGEAARVARPGGLVAVCNWGRIEDRDLAGVYAALGDLEPPADDDDDDGRPRPKVGEPGVLESLARAAGLEPATAADVDVPYESPDLDTLERAIVDGAGFHAAVDHSGAAAVRAALDTAAAPFRRGDGSYRFENRFRYVIARASAAGTSSKSTAMHTFSASQKKSTASGS